MRNGQYIFKTYPYSLSSRMSEKLEKAGYSIEERRFESRVYHENIFNATEEDIKKFQEMLEQIDKEIIEEDYENADKIFLENIADDAGLCGYIDSIRNVPDKYVKLYDNLYLDVEKTKNFSGSGIVLTVRENDTRRYGTFELGKLVSGRYKSYYEPDYIDVKVNYPDGTHSYIIKYENIENCEHFDLDIRNPKDVEILLFRNELRWPSINGTEREMAERLEKQGFEVVRVGRSGFASRNRYKIKLPGEITAEAVQEVQQAIEEQKQQKILRAYLDFEQSFYELSEDSNKTYAFVETGYDYSVQFDQNKYDEVLSAVCAYTADHRQGRGHTYLSLIFDKEKLQNDSRQTIVLYTPKAMIGKIIGKGGKNIKKLEQKYGKRFVIKESPREILKEAKAAEERKRWEERVAAEAEERKRERNVRDIILQLMKQLGSGIINKKSDELRESIAQYLLDNKDSLQILPNREELETIEKSLLDVQESYKQEQIRIIKEKTEIMCKNIDQALNVNNIEIMPKEEVRPFVENLFKDQEELQALIPQVSKIYEEKMEKRQVLADIKLEPLVAARLMDFFENEETHGYGYFWSVGKDRRRSAKTMIADQVMENIGYKIPEEGIYSDKFTDEDRLYYGKVQESVENVVEVVSQMETFEEMRDFLVEKSGRRQRNKSARRSQVPRVHVAQSQHSSKPEDYTIKTNSKGESISNSFSALEKLFNNNHEK